MFLCLPSSPVGHGSVQLHVKQWHSEGDVKDLPVFLLHQGHSVLQFQIARSLRLSPLLSTTTSPCHWTVYVVQLLLQQLGSAGVEGRAVRGELSGTLRTVLTGLPSCVFLRLQLATTLSRKTDKSQESTGCRQVHCGFQRTDNLGNSSLQVLSKFHSCDLKGSCTRKLCFALSM